MGVSFLALIGSALVLCAPAPLGVLVGAAWPSGVARAGAGEAAVQLSDGDAARAWASVGAGTAPAEVSRELRALLEPEAWRSPAAWRTWAECLDAEARAEQTDPERRAALCLFAAGQGRDDDAWRHDARLGADPSWAAAVMPFLLPGVPPGSALAEGGQAAPLAAPAVLRPILPPLPSDDRSGAHAPREARVRVRLAGGIELDMQLRADFATVRVDLEHVAGGAAQVAVRLPEPSDHELRLEYVDWLEKQARVAHEVVLEAADEEPCTIFGRLVASPPSLPTGEVEQVPAGIALGGVWLEGEETEPHPELLEALAEAFALPLEPDVRLRAPSDPAPEWGTLVRLGPVEDRAARLAHLAGQIESLLLP